MRRCPHCGGPISGRPDYDASDELPLADDAGTYLTDPDDGDVTGLISNG